MTKKWWQNSVVYQIYPRSYMDSTGNGVGDIKGIISRLDYLKNLGINVIWLSPVYESPMKDNGYDISNYQGIASEFGTMEDMEALLSQAKDRDIRIIMDLVVNHTSDQHQWFRESRKALIGGEISDNKYRDYYIWREAAEDGGVPNDIKSIFGGPAWTYDHEVGMYYFHLFDQSQPDLNWENDDLREDVHTMINWWLDKGVAGFRMDVIDLIGKMPDQGITGNGPKLHPYIKEMNHASFGPRDMLTVGETWGATPEVAKKFSAQERDELSMVFQFEHITVGFDEEKDKWIRAKVDMFEVKKVLAKWQEDLADEGWNSLFWNNHDLPRAVSRFGDDSQAYRVLSAKMLATTLHFLKGTPYIYQGEEIGMTNVVYDGIEDYNDIELLNFYNSDDYGYSQEEKMSVIEVIGRDNARTPMQWDMTINGGFTSGKPWLKCNANAVNINVEACLEDERSIFYHYKKLIQLRKDLELIVYGDFELLYRDDPNNFSYVRSYQGQEVVVINNLTSKVYEIEVDGKYLRENTGGRRLISNYDDSKLAPVIKLRSFESFAVLL